MTKDTSKRSPQQGLQLLQKALCPKMSSSIFQKITGIFGNLKTLLSKWNNLKKKYLLKRICSPAKYASLGQRKSGIAGLVQK